MNPAVLNYLQQMQQQNQEQQPVSNEQMLSAMKQQIPQQMPQAQQQVPFNPFDTGIRKAIESARESLGMTQKQQDKALRQSMLSFANTMSQQPQERGFFNNFASIGRAMSPALSTYDQEEGLASGQNYEMANKILGYKQAKEEAEALEREREFRRQLAEKQFGEQQRYRDLTFGAKNDQLAQRIGMQGTDQHNGNINDGGIGDILNQAEALITEKGSKGHRTRIGNFAAGYLPGGLPLNEHQAAIETLGDVLRGKLFNAWGYRNQAEFEHVPSISAQNSPETNKAIIKQLKLLFNQVKQENTQLGLPEQNPSSMPSQNNDPFAAFGGRSIQ